MISDIEVTPHKRVQEQGASKLPELTNRARLRAAVRSPTGNRCLVENFPFARGGNLCHVLPRSVSMENTVMSAIEYHLGMKFWTFNIDSSSNLFHAGATIHKMLDDGLFAFLPICPEVVEQLLPDEFPSRRDFPKFPDGPDGEPPVFQYALVPLKHDLEIQRMPIFREDPDGEGPQRLSVYHYPFTDFPIISSNILPHFVLLRLGFHLSKLSLGEIEEMGSFSRGDVKIDYSTVLQFWLHMLFLPDNYEADKGFYDDSGAPSPPHDGQVESDDTGKDKSYRPGISRASSRTVEVRVQGDRLAKTHPKSKGYHRQLDPVTPTKSGSPVSWCRRLVDRHMREAAEREKLEHGGAEKKQKKSNRADKGEKSAREILPLPRRARGRSATPSSSAGEYESVVGGRSVAGAMDVEAE